MRLSRLGAALAAAGAATLLAGCGGSSEPSFPTIGAARTYELADFRPAGRIEPGVPTQLSFRIEQPSGEPLTDYATGSGPHTGIHLILVRDDLSELIHHHPPLDADGTLRDTVTFPKPGRYRMVVDAYPATGAQKNLQLFRWITVPGQAADAPLPAFRPSETVDGYRFSILGKPKLRAIEADFLRIRVTRPDGTAPTFRPWLGALAHAIFFRKGTVDYFHTHVCAPGAAGCASSLGGATVTGKSTKPGELNVGVLLAVPGTWRLFVQTEADGKVLTAPFTLQVAP